MGKVKSFFRDKSPQCLLTLYRFIRLIVNRHFFIIILNRHFTQRFHLIYRLIKVHSNVCCPHNQGEILAIISSIISIPHNINGCIVEAGCYKGGSTAKLSIATKMNNRQLVVFDSFEGFPENSENNGKDIFGGKIGFPKGSYTGSLDEVSQNVKNFGEIEVCRFVKGWFKDTMPSFSENICVVFLDVDLPSSTRDCLKYLYPLLISGGVLFSHDGHIPSVVDVYNDDIFWQKEVCCDKPYIQGLGEKKLLKIIKP